MTNYDHLIPAAKKLIAGLAGKPGIRIVDKEIAANFLAQALNGMLERGEIKAMQGVGIGRGGGR